MGNVASGRRRPAAVEERLTRPRRLLRELPDVDAGRLRRLIRNGDLAPCFDAAEDAVGGQGEECPICFYFYPSLNRSKCCGKGICTECFLQLMPSNASKVVHCPFCKIKSYAIEYQGARTTSAKKIEQEEEQNVNETKMRVHSKSQIAGEIILP
ncbi:E3 ubiquitin-protein ligase GW2-like [Phragmites australis]|uniref:E3 ubiquitin-protein ligase GW2-like n=1 Tax=Phragmites australis TaxID=29695 RepID=UPI002D79F8B3|nr:E3 ubiquitin-protein ligase GW2-like [Phragmites australis]